MIHYLIAKYVDDLSRNEPTNIGIVVYDGRRWAARFDGEDDEARIDLRRVRSRVTGTQSYRAWVDYWRAILNEPAQGARSLRNVPAGDPRVIEHLVTLAANDFYLEHGGTLLHDVDDRTMAETLGDLFARLVRQADPPAPLSLQEKSKEALRVAGAPLGDEERFKERLAVTFSIGRTRAHEEVSYAVKNGSWHYLQVMPFDPGQPRRSRKEAHHCAFLFEHLPEMKDAGLILYDGSDLAIDQHELLELLLNFAPTVDVNRTDQAALTLQDALNLG